jgi:hypothetical protein
MKKGYYIIPAVLVIFCLLTAMTTRVSYRNDLMKRIQNYNYQSNDELQNVFDSKKFHSPDDLIQQADAIIKCQFSGNRQITDEAFYTPVLVSDVYKGNSELKGKTLTIVETINVIENYKITPNYFLLTTQGFYIPLQKGEDYILLIKKLPLNKARKSGTFLDSQYYPVSESAFGVYRISDIKQTKLINIEKDNIPFSQLSGFDLFASEQEQLDTYYQYKQQIFKAIGIL